MRRAWFYLLPLLLTATPAAPADGVFPDEIGFVGLRIYDDVKDLGDSWSGIGGRVGWHVIGPVIGEAEVWKATQADSDGASGALVSAKVLAEGLVTGVFGRVGLGRYRGQSAVGYGGGMELYVIKKVVLRGEAMILHRQSDNDLMFSFGVAFRP